MVFRRRVAGLVGAERIFEREPIDVLLIFAQPSQRDRKLAT